MKSKRNPSAISANVRPAPNKVAIRASVIGLRFLVLRTQLEASWPPRFFLKPKNQSVACFYSYTLNDKSHARFTQDAIFSAITHIACPFPLGVFAALRVPFAANVSSAHGEHSLLFNACPTVEGYERRWHRSSFAFFPPCPGQCGNEFRTAGIQRSIRSSQRTPHVTHSVQYFLINPQD